MVRGTYILSTLTAAQVDESKNVGLVIKYRAGKKDIVRINTRSLSSVVGSDDADIEEVACQGSRTEMPQPKILALSMCFQSYISFLLIL